MALAEAAVVGLELGPDEARAVACALAHFVDDTKAKGHRRPGGKCAFCGSPLTAHDQDCPWPAMRPALEKVRRALGRCLSYDPDAD